MGSSRRRATTGVSFAQLAARRPREEKLILPPDDGAEQLQRAVDEARSDLQLAQLRTGFAGDEPAEQAAIDRLKATLAAAEADLEAAGTVLVVRALPGPELEALRLAHPAPQEKLEAARKERPGEQVRVDPVTFDPALIAAAVVITPRLTAEQVLELKAAWSEADYEALRLAVLRVNGESKIGLLGN